jgi:TatD DNase family protein
MTVCPFSASSPLRWIDSHCHLTDQRFDEDRDAVLDRARQAGVVRTVVVADSLTSSREALDLARSHEGLYATAGLHPHHAAEWTDAHARELCDLLRDGAVSSDRSGFVAVGEAGLDFYYDFAPRDAQVLALQGQIEVAREVGLPLVLHCRDAHDLFLDLLREQEVGAVGGVVHCFSGTPEQARRIVDLGLSLGVGGTLTFKTNDQGREAARVVPLDALVLETDAPYLAPVPKRGARNEPAWVPYVAARLAVERGISEENLSQALWTNTIRLFRLPEVVPAGCRINDGQ